MRKGGWGITENYSDLNMAILPSGMTEDKVHRQLCDRSTCQWNVFHSSYCKTQCIMVITLMSRHSWSYRKEKRKSGMVNMCTSNIANLNCRGGLRKRGREVDEEVRGQLGNGYFSPRSATLTCSSNPRHSSVTIQLKTEQT